MADRWHSPKDDKAAAESDRLKAVSEEIDRLGSLLSSKSSEQKDELLYAVLRALLKSEEVPKEEGTTAPPVNDEGAIDAAIEWLWEKWEKAHCPYCGEGPWEVEGPFSIRLDDEATLSPIFTVMCTNCGQTAFVNAVQAGIVGEPKGDGDDG